MEKNSKYKLVSYWDERYKEEEYYEWFGDYNSFKDTIKCYIKASSNIIILGCGNSRMSEDLYNDGYLNITNIDYSSIVIESMAQKYILLKQMRWLVMVRIGYIYYSRLIIDILIVFLRI